MHFIIGENFWSQLERMTYRGAIGIFYESTLGGLISYIVFGLIFIFTVIGVITTMKGIFTGFGHKSKTPYEAWEKQYNKNKKKK